MTRGEYIDAWCAGTEAAFFRAVIAAGHDYHSYTADQAAEVEKTHANYKAACFAFWENEGRPFIGRE